VTAFIGKKEKPERIENPCVGGSIPSLATIQKRACRNAGPFLLHLV